MPSLEEQPHISNTKTLILPCLSSVSLGCPMVELRLGLMDRAWEKPPHLWCCCAVPTQVNTLLTGVDAAHMCRQRCAAGTTFAHGLLSMQLQSFSAPTNFIQTMSACFLCATNSPMTSNLSMRNRALSICCHCQMPLLVYLSLLFTSPDGRECHILLTFAL